MYSVQQAREPPVNYLPLAGAYKLYPHARSAVLLLFRNGGTVGVLRVPLLKNTVWYLLDEFLFQGYALLNAKV